MHPWDLQQKGHLLSFPSRARNNMLMKRYMDQQEAKIEAIEIIPTPRHIKV
jgi:hypothetical protein